MSDNIFDSKFSIERPPVPEKFLKILIEIESFDRNNMVVNSLRVWKFIIKVWLATPFSKLKCIVAQKVKLLENF